MQSLFEYLASAPKAHLVKLYRRDYPEAGLQQSARVIEAVQARALDAERLRGALAQADREARRLLLAVYAAEERGLFEAELLRGCAAGASQASYLLAGLEYELLVFSREGEARSYHGFREMAPLLMPTLMDEFAASEAGPASAAWVSNATHVLSHFCHFLAKAARGELRLTQTRELHRKSLQDLAQGFSSGAPLAEAAAAEETLFLYRFAAEAGLLREEEGVLRLSEMAADWLEEGRAELRRRLWEWWLRRRMRGLSRTLAALSHMENEQVPVHAVAALASLFSVYEGWEAGRSKTPAEWCTWENLPRTLRELWMIGGADLALHKGRIRWVRVRPNEDGKTGALDSGLTESPRGLPNLEALVPISVPLSRQFQVELVAARGNDEMLTRYRFTKDSVVQGLQAGMTADALQELAAWLGFEASARRALADWAAAYVTAVFREIFVLRVRDAGRFVELEEFPQFMELVTETIPGYGFVLPRAAKPRARELLRVFDLLPGEEIAHEAGNNDPLILEASDPQWALPAFPHGEIAYRHAPPIRRELPSMGDRGARARVEETVAERMQMLEGAVRLQKTVEFTYNGAVGKRIRAQPLHVLRNRDPIKLIAVELGSGHRNEYLLDQIQGLHLLELA